MHIISTRHLMFTGDSIVPVLSGSKAMLFLTRALEIDFFGCSYNDVLPHRAYVHTEELAKLKRIGYLLYGLFSKIFFSYTS